MVSLCFDIWVLGSKIAIDCTYRASGQCCLSHVQVVGSNIAIGLYVLGMWSVLCVPYVGVGV